MSAMSGPPNTEALRELEKWLHRRDLLKLLYKLNIRGILRQMDAYLLESEI